jgi:hypothetical protein
MQGHEAAFAAHDAAGAGHEAHEPCLFFIPSSRDPQDRGDPDVAGSAGFLDCFALLAMTKGKVERHF